MNFPKTAFLLGAGLGTRLRPLTDRCPKPLLPLGDGEPMLCHTMATLLAHGVERFIVNTHHAADVYAEKFPQKNFRGAPLTFVHEPVLLDTGGGRKNFAPVRVPADENLLVYNVDILASLDLKKLALAHAKNGALATLLLRTDARGNVNFCDAKNTVCDMRDRLGVAGTRRCKFTGIYLVSRAFFNEIPAGKIESVVEAFLRVIARGNEEIRGVVDDVGAWRDLGTRADYDAACAAAFPPSPHKTV